MILPTTYVSALLLLVLSFLLLGSLVNTFKLAGKQWRFELFSIDFAIGALLLAGGVIGLAEADFEAYLLGPPVLGTRSRDP